MLIKTKRLLLVIFLKNIEKSFKLSILRKTKNKKPLTNVE